MNFGFVSTRFAGTDGVSLEAAKWAEALWADGHVSHWYSGLSDRQAEVSMCVPEAFFAHEKNEWINQRIWGRTTRSAEVSRAIRQQTDYLKSSLYEFVDQFSIDILVPENALTIPMHIPLGLAITEYLMETGLPSISHHHDFYWERSRFTHSGINDLLDSAFPPRVPGMVHAVINSSAQDQLARRKGLGSHLVPNVFDFETPAPEPDDYASDIREEIGLEEDDIFILQPTRIVPRKGIEHAIRLVSLLKNPKCKLIISHDAGDEGFEYQELLLEMAEQEEVDLRIIADRVGEDRETDSQGRKIYTLWDLYPHCDMVTYPSLYEGFGNALVEAIYFKKPVVINRYSVYIEDIEPKGFKLAEMDGVVTKDTIREVEKLLSDQAYRKAIVEHNYEVGQRHYSYEVLRRSFATIFGELGGTNNSKP